MIEKEPIGIICGSSLLRERIKGKKASFGKKEKVKTPFGEVELLKKGNAFLIQRHSDNTPPHMINHKANIAALKEKGVKEIIGICSTGSLKKEITPPSLVIPDDYINWGKIHTFFDNERKHITPRLSERVRKRLLKACKKTNLKIHKKGVYFQTRGPRLETKAEIRILKDYAHVVGMTMASEATLAKEMGIHYAGICSVDNLAHGITEKPLTEEEIGKSIEKNGKEMKKLLEELIK